MPSPLVVGKFLDGEPRRFMITRSNSIEEWEKLLGKKGTLTRVSEMDQEGILAYRFLAEGDEQFFAVRIPETKRVA